MIKAKDLSEYSVEQISLNAAEAKFGTFAGKTQRYAVLTMRDIESFAAKPCKLIFWEEDSAAVIEVLSKYVDATKVDPHGGKLVDLAALDADPMGKRLLTFYGIQQVRMPLLKGMCYANQKDGSPLMDKQGNRVMRDSVPVVCQVKYIMDDGTVVYFPGMDPETARDRIEKSFYQAKVGAIPTPTAQSAQQPPLQAPTTMPPTTQTVVQQPPIAQPVQQPNGNVPF